MPLPSQLPEWNSGGANRTEPSVGVKAAGWTVNGAVISSYFNWWMFRVYEWTQYLQGLAGELMTWTNTHVFTKGIIVANSVASSIAGSFLAGGTKRALYTEGTSTFNGATTSLGHAVEIVGAGVGLDSQTTGGNLMSVASGVASTLTLENNGAGHALDLSSIGNKALQVSGGAGGSGGSFAADFLNFLGAGAAFFKGGGVDLAVGAKFKGADAADGATVPGIAGHFTGGTAGGVGSSAVYGKGGAFAPGATFEAGVGSGAGVEGLGGNVGIGGPGLLGRNGVSTWGPAVESRGSVDFANATLAPGGQETGNALTKLAFPKHAGFLSLNGTAAPALVRGQGIASVSQAVNGEITITWVNPWPDGFYLVEADAFEALTTTGGFDKILVKFGTQTTTSVVLIVERWLSGVTPVMRDRSQTSGLLFFFKTWGIR